MNYHSWACYKGGLSVGGNFVREFANTLQAESAVQKADSREEKSMILIATSMRSLISMNRGGRVFAS